LEKSDHPVTSRFAVFHNTPANLLEGQKSVMAGGEERQLIWEGWSGRVCWRIEGEINCTLLLFRIIS